MVETGSILHSTTGFVHPSIQVIQAGQTRYLRFGHRGGWQGALDLSRPNRPVFPYQRAFATVVSGIPQLTNYLSIGVGIGTSLKTVKMRFPEAHLQAVELDETVLNLAIQYFNAPAHDEVQYWVGDGVQFLSRGTKGPYDLIFLDAYMSNKVYTPSLEPNFASVLAGSTGSNGIVMVNLIATIPFRGSIKRFLDSAARSFQEIWFLPVGVPFLEQNILAILFKSRNSVLDLAKVMKKASDISVVEKAVWPWRIRRYRH